MTRLEEVTHAAPLNRKQMSEKEDALVLESWKAGGVFLVSREKCGGRNVETEAQIVLASFIAPQFYGCCDEV